MSIDIDGMETLARYGAAATPNAALALIARLRKAEKERDEHEQARTALEEALGQVMAERDAALEREQALAAHVERIKAHARYVGHTNPEESITAQILSEGPATSLAQRDARLKALWQAEAMSEALDALEYMDREVGSDRGALDATRDDLSDRLSGYRRQAKGGER